MPVFSGVAKLGSSPFGDARRAFYTARADESDDAGFDAAFNLLAAAVPATATAALECYGRNRRRHGNCWGPDAIL